MAINVFEVEVAREHHHLSVIEKLSKLFSRTLGPLMLRSHPHFTGLLE
jgi:hypothetical protein